MAFLTGVTSDPKGSAFSQVADMAAESSRPEARQTEQELSALKEKWSILIAMMEMYHLTIALPQSVKSLLDHPVRPCDPMAGFFICPIS